jgi:hypothetical protein
MNFLGHGWEAKIIHWSGENKAQTAMLLTRSDGLYSVKIMHRKVEVATPRRGNSPKISLRWSRSNNRCGAILPVLLVAQRRQ